MDGILGLGTGEYAPARCHRCQWSPRTFPQRIPVPRDLRSAGPGFTSGPSRRWLGGKLWSDVAPGKARKHGLWGIA